MCVCVWGGSCSVTGGGESWTCMGRGALLHLATYLGKPSLNHLSSKPRLGTQAMSTMTPAPPLPSHAA